MAMTSKKCKKCLYSEPAISIVWLRSEMCICASNFGANDLIYDDTYENAFGDED